jgi:hypothetical protein
MTRQNIFIAIFVVLLAGAGYSFFMTGDETLAEITQNSVGTQFQERLAQLRRLKTIEFDTSVLRDPFFNSLTSLGVLVQPSSEITGRTNPFLPF